MASPSGRTTHVTGKQVRFVLAEGESYTIRSTAPGHVPHEVSIAWREDSGYLKGHAQGGKLLMGLVLALGGAAAGLVVDLFTGFTGIGALTGALIAGGPATVWGWASVISDAREGRHDSDTDLTVTLQDEHMRERLLYVPPTVPADRR
jgi:hypothetical protein